MFRHHSVYYALIFMAVTTLPVFAGDQTKTVFVTHAQFSGNFGGIAEADKICQAEAESPQSKVPLGTYLAWLSDGKDSPDTRFAKATEPYVLPDGTMIAENYADLTDGSLMHQIDNEASGKLVALEYTWTGTKSDGTSASDWLTCNQWTAEHPTDVSGMGGATNRKDSIWSSRHASVECARKHRLWCFQQ